MSEILGEATIETLLSDLCDVDGLRKATKAKGIADSHAALRSRLSALEEENAQLRDLLSSARCYFSADSPMGLAIRRALDSALSKLRGVRT